MDEDGFYLSQLMTGESGLVPSNFVEKVDGEDGGKENERGREGEGGGGGRRGGGREGEEERERGRKENKAQ